MSTLGDELADVEYDLFDVISDAVKRGLTRQEIDLAYRAASAQVFNKPTRGRPKGSLGKGKKIVQHLYDLQMRLISDLDKRDFTAAREVLADVPAKQRPTPQHLVRTLHENKTATAKLKFLRLLNRAVKLYAAEVQRREVMNKKS